MAPPSSRCIRRRIRGALHVSCLAASVAGVASVVVARVASAQGARARSVGVVTGTVSDRATGSPIAGASVRARPIGGGSAAGPATSSEVGRYRLQNVAAGRYVLEATAVGYQVRRQDTVTVPAGETVIANLPLTETSVLLNQVVTTASRGTPEKVLDAPASISVVGSEEIARRQSVTVADLVRSQPGVDATQGGIAQTNLVARGFNNVFSGSLLTLQDYRFAGVPSLRVNVPFLFTGTNDDIDRVEVLLGPAAALYGPNSANGVMHVITKSPFTSRGTSLSLEGGERALLRVTGRHAAVAAERIGFKVSGEYFRANDFEFADPAEPATFDASAPASRRGQPNRRDFGLERYTGEARLDLRPSERLEAITTLGYTNFASGLELTGANGAAQVHNWTYTSLQQRVRWNRLFAQAFVNVSDAGNRDSLDTRGTFLLRTGTPIVDQSRVAVAQLQHATDVGVRQTFVYGGDFILTNPRTGSTTNGRNEQRDDVVEYGAYLQSVTRFDPRWELTAAARIDRNDRIDGVFFSPRAALAFKPTETAAWRVAFNRAFQTPANFSLFLDLPQASTPFGVVRAIGVDPEDGIRLRRDCTAGVGSLCMRASNVVPAALRGGVLPATAAPFYQVMLGAAVQGGLVSGLVQNGVPAPLAQAIVQRLQTAAPTAAQIGTVLRSFNPASAAAGGSPFPGAATPADAVRDESPLAPSFVNNYEVGFKGIVAHRVRLAVDAWHQQRVDFVTPAQLFTPNVFADPAALGPFVGQQVAAAAGTSLTPAQIASIASRVTTALAGVPVGTITGEGALFEDRNDVMFSYRSVDETIRLWGSDVAVDVELTPSVTLAGTYSYVSDGVFPSIPGGNGEPLRLNSPQHKGSAALRLDRATGLAAELRYRYADAYRVNSAVYLGDVPVQRFLDASVSFAFDLGGRRMRWTVSGTNVLDNEVPTFVGTPAIGRLLTTRVAYAF